MLYFFILSLLFVWMLSQNSTIIKQVSKFYQGLSFPLEKTKQKNNNLDCACLNIFNMFNFRSIGITRSIGQSISYQLKLSEIPQVWPLNNKSLLSHLVYYFSDVSIKKSVEASITKIIFSCSPTLHHIKSRPRSSIVGSSSSSSCYSVLWLLITNAGEALINIWSLCTFRVCVLLSESWQRCKLMAFNTKCIKQLLTKRSKTGVQSISQTCVTDKYLLNPLLTAHYESSSSSRLFSPVTLHAWKYMHAR